MSEAPEYGPEDEVVEAVPEDEDLPEDEIDDSKYDMDVMSDHMHTAMKGEDD
jgi:hypothetical protein